MKKKLRKIHVGVEDFHWAISNDKEGYVMLRIYRGKQKNHPWIVRFNCQDPWLYFGEWSPGTVAFTPITPGKVSDIIKKIQILLEQRGIYKLSTSEMNFYISKEEELFLI